MAALSKFKKYIYRHSRHAAHSLQLLPNARRKRVHVERPFLSEVLTWGILLCGGAGDQRRPRHLSLRARGEVASPSGPQPSQAGEEERRWPRPPPEPWPPGPAPHSLASAWAWRPLVFQQSGRPQGVALWLLKVWRKVCFRSVPSAVLSNTTFLPCGRPVPLGFWEAWGPTV